MPHFATQVLRDHFVDQATFDAAHAEWGEAGLVDIIGCLGNFSMLAMLLNTFQVDLKPGDEPPFPDVRGFAKVDPAVTAGSGSLVSVEVVPQTLQERLVAAVARTGQPRTTRPPAAGSGR